MEKEEFNWLIERLKTEEVVMVNRQGVIDNVHGYIVPLTLSQTYGGISQNLVEQLLQKDEGEWLKNFTNGGLIVVNREGTLHFHFGMYVSSSTLAVKLANDYKTTMIYSTITKSWIDLK